MVVVEVGGQLGLKVRNGVFEENRSGTTELFHQSVAGQHAMLESSHPKWSP